MTLITADDVYSYTEEALARRVAMLREVANDLMHLPEGWMSAGKLIMDVLEDPACPPDVIEQLGARMFTYLRDEAHDDTITEVRVAEYGDRVLALAALNPYSFTLSGASNVRFSSFRGVEALIEPDVRRLMRRPLRSLRAGEKASEKALNI